MGENARARGALHWWGHSHVLLLCFTEGSVNGGCELSLRKVSKLRYSISSDGWKRPSQWSADQLQASALQ